MIKNKALGGARRTQKPRFKTTYRSHRTISEEERLLERISEVMLSQQYASPSVPSTSKTGTETVVYISQCTSVNLTVLLSGGGGSVQSAGPAHQEEAARKCRKQREHVRGWGLGRDKHSLWCVCVKG